MRIEDLATPVCCPAVEVRAPGDEKMHRNYRCLIKTKRLSKAKWRG